MAPAVEPNPEPIALLPEVDELEALELLDDELALMRSEKRLELPLEAPKLEAGELPAEEPDVLEEDVLVAVFEEAIAVVEALMDVEPELTLEAFELEFREETRLPLELLLLPCNCGARSAAKRSAWIVPFNRTVRFNSPDAMTAVRNAATEGPPPPFSGGTRSRFKYRAVPPIIASAASPQIMARGRGLGGTGLTISGRDGVFCGSAPPNGLGTEALLIWKCMSDPNQNTTI
jgi:hypothetical protein